MSIPIGRVAVQVGIAKKNGFEAAEPIIVAPNITAIASMSTCENAGENLRVADLAKRDAIKAMSVADEVYYSCGLAPSSSISAENYSQTSKDTDSKNDEEEDESETYGGTVGLVILGVFLMNGIIIAAIIIFVEKKKKQTDVGKGTSILPVQAGSPL